MMSPGRLVALILTMGLAGCGSKDPVRPLIERYPQLETVEPAYTSLPVRVELLATVEPFEKADLCARLPGVVEELPRDVDIGRRVKAGEKLVRLAVPDLEADQASKEALLEQSRKQKLQVMEMQKVAAKELEEAREQENRHKAEFAFRRDQHQRTTQLVERGAIQPERAQETRSQMEVAESGWRGAKAQIETKQAKLEALAVDLDVAESRIKVAAAEWARLTALVDYATLKAPFDGVITHRWVDRGTTIKDAGTPLLRVMNTSTVRVLIDVSERDVPLLNATEQNPNPDGLGDPVVVRFSSLRDVVPGGEFRGWVTRLAQALDPATRTMRAEIHLDNRAGHLRPSMTGTASVLLEERSNRHVIPSTALVRRGNDTEVYFVTDLTGDPPRGVLQAARVELGLDDGQRAEIRAGLPDKVRVIAKASSVIREGDTIIALPLRDR